MVSDEEKEPLIARTRADLQALAAEEVIAFGFFGQAGLYDPSPTLAVREGYAGGGIVPLLRSFFGRARGGGLPLQVVVALTGTRVLAVAYTAGRGGIEPTKVVQAWDRNGARVEVEEGCGDLPHVILSAPGEAKPVRLESADPQRTGINDELLALLRA